MPTTPTSTRSSARTTRRRSRSSATTCPSRARPAGRTSSSSGTTSSTRSSSTTTATRCRTSRTSSGSGPTLQNEDTFLYNTGPITSLTDPELEQATALRRLRHPRARPPERQEAAPRAGRQGQGHRRQPRVPAVQHRPALDAELRRPCGGGRASPAVRRDGLRRPAERRLLRRPGLGLRPRRPPAVPEPPSDPDGRSAGRRPAEGPEHPHDRHQGADLDADQGRLHAERPDEPRRPCSASGAARAGARCKSATTTGRRRRGAGRGCRSRASATRSSTR